MGSVAIVTGQLGPDVGDAALVSEWSQGKVQRVALTPAATAYDATVTPFLTGLTNPLPLIRAADGAVLVGDWSSGTIYRISAV